jgi:SsrA-binding protein
MKIINRRARHDYFLMESIEAGLALTGNEAKSLLQGRAELGSSFVRIRDGEAWLVGANILPYGAIQSHYPLRSRKLLLNKAEITSLDTKMKQQNLTLVPVLLYNKGRLIKAKLSLARGKRQFEKREAKRRKDLDREAETALKDR